jgi:hypothetical protein
MTESKGISQRERQELRRIVKARFEVIQQGLHQRKQEASRQIRERIEAEHTEAIKGAQKEIAEFAERTDLLKAEAKKLQSALREKGVEPAVDYYRSRRQPAPSFLTLEVEQEWRPINIDAKVDKELEALMEASGLATLNLRIRELELIEEITVGAIESEQARVILDRIPKLDELIPLPEGSKKALNGGS